MTPGATLGYGGMGPGFGFTGRAPGEIELPNVIPVNANPQNHPSERAKPDIAAVLAEPLRKTGGKTWWESTQGRMGTRLFSRGLFGSFAYAIASMAVERAMQRYTPYKSIGDTEHYKYANKPWHKFIRGSAKMFDKLGGDGVIFRDTRFFGRTDKTTGLEVMGRSFGHEYVDVVFNFAAASIGDSTARNLAGLIDPNKPVSWMEGGKLDVKKFFASQAKAVWKTLTYFAGEDFAVGAIYIMSMKAQRAMMNKFSPGFKYVFDYGNSDAYKVDHNGKLTGKTYYAENVIDYQLRFSNYNVLTLMFRETYNSVGDRINSWFKGGDKPKVDMPDSFGDAAGRAGKFLKGLGRYIVHSTIKGYVMMTLTVPFFSLLRIPQAKRGPFGAMAVNPEFGPMMIGAEHLGSPVGPDGRPVPKFMNVRPLTPDFRNRMDPKSNLTDGVEFFKPSPNADGSESLVPLSEQGPTPMKLRFFEEGKLPNVPTPTINPYAKPYDRSEPTKPFESFDPYGHANDELGGQRLGRWNPRRLFNDWGRASNEWGTQLYNRLSDMAYGHRDKSLDAAVDIAESEKDLRSASSAGVNAIMPYTAYFVVKTENGQRDTPEMDRQIDKVQDAVVELDGKKLIEGVKGIAREFIKPSKNTGAGSVFGHDNADTTNATPWSKRVPVAAVQTSHLERAASRTGAALPAKPAPAPENWRDRNAAASEATTSQALS